ncbi:yrdc domain-containing protein, mitochondrial [Plakobranchus ocellatus]|uniref:Threonylcarbamoyl-AMP synthase n=1 Tax=Plakobranchus ocellatus TaxID=259542 RepID=A0AAV4A952_9GAST|nr:yrdc domain-containing protein, mitochondrial [Plakobranchus ocellatus]
METSDAEDFAAILYAEPGALGLIANIVAALMIATENMLDLPFSTAAVTLSGVHLIVVGGFLQIVAGLLSYRRWDHLTATAFLVFGSLWTSVGISRVLTAQAPPDGEDAIREATLPGLVGFMAVAVVLCLCAVTVNFLLPPVLVAILLTLVFEAVGAWFAWGRRVAAAFELIIVLAGVYAVVVMMLKGVSQRYILPGFGNAPYDPLLMRTAGGPAPKNEKKKVTKYSEPMGMGFLGNVIPATVLAFYHLGFFSDFRPAVAMFVFSAVCQVLASFYSFLRHDFYHAIVFIIYAVFWNSRAVLQFLISSNFSEIMDSRVNFYGQWTLVALLLVTALLSASVNRVVFIFNVMFVVMAILSIDHIPVNVHDFTFGIASAIVAVLSLYTGMSALENSIAEKNVMYIGAEVIHSDKMSAAIGSLFGTLQTEKSGNTGSKREYDDDDYVDVKIVDTIIFISSAIALMSHSATEASNSIYPLAWIMVAGVFLHAYAARLAYAAGSLAKSYVAFLLAIYWLIWTAFMLYPNLALVLRGLSVGMLCLFTIAMVMTPTFASVWLPFSVMMELCVITQVVTVFDVNPRWMILVTSLLAGQYSLYAVELYRGRVVGVPTDTVYALAGSCKVPQSIEEIYRVKERPPEKPICLCLSNLDQLAEVNPPFSPLLWNFMRRCYPGGISCVVAKGDWLKNLGLGDSADKVGTQGSICIRVPDSSVLAYLVSLSGPIALTSANPSGGADSTHHDMVISSLGKKLAGVVCDGPSNELVASTVVNCMKIDEGVITYFRIGCTPQEVVDAHFEAAQAEIRSQSATLDMNEKLS